VGIARSTFYRWCEDDLEFRISAEDAQFRGREKMNDFVESKLLENIGANSMQAIRFWLSHNTTRYSYVNAEEIQRLRGYEKTMYEFTAMIINEDDDAVLKILHDELAKAKEHNAKYGRLGL